MDEAKGISPPPRRTKDSNDTDAIDGRQAQAVAQQEKTARMGREAMARLIRPYRERVQIGGTPAGITSERETGRGDQPGGAGAMEEIHAQRNDRP